MPAQSRYFRSPGKNISSISGAFPSYLKDAHGGGWKQVYKINNMEELWTRYNESGLLTMILQEFIRWDNYIRCMCLDQSDILVMKYDPTNRQYLKHDLDTADSTTASIAIR